VRREPCQSDGPVLRSALLWLPSLSSEMKTSNIFKAMCVAKGADRVGIDSNLMPFKSTRWQIELTWYKQFLALLSLSSRYNEFNVYIMISKY
jgi:hypothetical protein